MGFWHYCSVYSKPVTMQSIVTIESGGNPYAIDDDTAHRSYFLRSRQSAILTAKRLLAMGHNIDMGLAQINSSNLYIVGGSVSRLFNPCYNIEAGSYILYKFYVRALSVFGYKQALFRSLMAYNTGSYYRGYNYAYKVWYALQ
jgi:type IV secretion system protein VirB1